MKIYVVGLMFDPSLDRVALIKKTKPEWQAGKFNGIGGKVEEGEAPIDAMAREFREEAGMETNYRDWNYFLRMQGTENGDNGRADGAFLVEFFWATGDIDRLRCVTEEEVEVHFIRRVMASEIPTLENIPWVVALAIDSIRDGRPSFTTANYY